MHRFDSPLGPGLGMHSVRDSVYNFLNPQVRVDGVTGEDYTGFNQEPQLTDYIAAAAQIPRPVMQSTPVEPQSASISPERFLGLANGTDTLETLSGFPQNALPQAAVAPSVQPTQYAVPATPDYVPQAIPDIQAGISDPTDWNTKLGTLSALTGGLAVPMIPQFNAGGPQQTSAPASQAKSQSQRAHGPQTRATQAGQGYAVQPGMSMQPTNVPGQTQLNLVQNQLRFNDPEYQRLYALRDAQVRQALQARGLPYEEAMAATRMGVPLNL